MFLHWRSSGFTAHQTMKTYLTTSNLDTIIAQLNESDMESKLGVLPFTLFLRQGKSEVEEMVTVRQRLTRPILLENGRQQKGKLYYDWNHLWPKMRPQPKTKTWHKLRMLTNPLGEIDSRPPPLSEQEAKLRVEERNAAEGRSIIREQERKMDPHSEFILLAELLLKQGFVALCENGTRGRFQYGKIVEGNDLLRRKRKRGSKDSFIPINFEELVRVRFIDVSAK